MSSEFDLQTEVELREFVGFPGDGFLDLAMTRDGKKLIRLDSVGGHLKV